MLEQLIVVASAEDAACNIWLCKATALLPKGKLRKGRANFPSVGTRRKEEGRNKIIRFYTGIKRIT